MVKEIDAEISQSVSNTYQFMPSAYAVSSAISFSEEPASCKFITVVTGFTHRNYSTRTPLLIRSLYLFPLNSVRRLGLLQAFYQFRLQVKYLGLLANK
jgi:hypothetical protein